ncbi:MAG: metalloenzyme [Myxococcota bacterium]|nr:metalloenzyme [Myxococcota bacterium]
MATLGLRRFIRSRLSPQKTSGEPAAVGFPDPPIEGKSCVLVVLDSCRYDALVQANSKCLASLGDIQRRWSYASWTAPSHHNMLMGLLPHASPSQTLASTVYREELQRWGERLGLPDLGIGGMLPGLWLPDFLRDTLGYRTTGLVSMPVLHPHTPINRGFDTYKLMPSHNDMSAMLDELRFFVERPGFALLNVGETHYPYAPTGEAELDLPRISGLRGTIRDMDQRLRDGNAVSAEEGDAFFDAAQLKRLQARQVDAVRSLEPLFEALFDLVPPGTWITVTADHGELFGEAGYFGHGPIRHDKVHEVPLIEGRIR